MPPVPTFPTVKLRPSLLSGTVSSGFVFLLDLVERCLKTSVEFFARLREFDVFLSEVLGAELFLVCLRDTSVSGVFVLFLGLEPYCEDVGAVVVRVVPVM